VRPAARLRFSRLRLLALTGLDLGLVALSTLGLQDGRLWLKALSLLLLALSASALLLLCREWFSPSYVEFGGETLAVKWNNWRLAGSRLRAELIRSRPRSLELEVGSPSVSLDPVGPLHLSAMFAVWPLLASFLPPHLARMYFLDSRRLSDLLGPGGGPAVVRFPVFLFGRRRIRHALEKDLG
jgi:hypothetical protein